MNSIKLIGIKLCNYCNLNCEMCAQKKSKVEHQNIDVKNLISFIEQFPINKFEAYLWGGEPFLHKNVFEIIDFFEKKGCPVTINTNGTLLYKYSDKICNHKIYRIIVSIDGTRDTHNQIRGRKVYDNIILGIKKIIQTRKHLPFITANIVVTQKNQYILLDTVENLFSIGIEFIEIQLPIFYTQTEGMNYEDWCFNEIGIHAISWKGFKVQYDYIDTIKLSSTIEKLVNKYGKKIHLVPNINVTEIYEYFNSKIKPKKGSICLACKNQIRIEADGSVVLCPDFPDIIIGNINRESILDILKKEPYSTIRKNLSNNALHLLCNKCPFRYE